MVVRDLAETAVDEPTQVPLVAVQTASDLVDLRGPGAARSVEMRPTAKTA